MKTITIFILGSSIKQKCFLFLALCFSIWYLFFSQLSLKFTDSYSKIVFSEEGELLQANVADDGQWRFNEADSNPKQLKTCLLLFEDKDFYNHIGISINGICRAIVQNCKRKKIVSGGSTITMQTIRLMRKNPKRTMLEKCLEMILATRLEMKFSKNKILNLYMNHAPFGGNVVGVQAAAWRYFGRSVYHLSWSEYATLAVLPNSPGLIYPGKNHDRLFQKRNRLLKKLFLNQIIDASTYELSIVEPLPNKPLHLPQSAPHIFTSDIKQAVIKSTIQQQMQTQLLQIVSKHQVVLKQNYIRNMAIIVTDVNTGNIVGYIGNVQSTDSSSCSWVNCATAHRSTGSILKPILFESSLQAGIISPYSILPDAPIQFGNFCPKNYNKTYDGVVAADEALSRSLNIPFVHLLNHYGVNKFAFHLSNLGMKAINKQKNQFGLSLILGGTEASLTELNTIYVNMAKTLIDTSTHILFKNKATIYQTFEAMTAVNRPDELGNWKLFTNTKKIAWKTGTSFGNRDAWSVGITPNYVVSVWVGNASGEGRSGLTGIQCAAPVLFDVFNILPNANDWFQKPLQDYLPISVCKQSGFLPSLHCKDIMQLDLPSTCTKVPVCTYHQLKPSSSEDMVGNKMGKKSNFENTVQACFVLLPSAIKYYQAKNPTFSQSKIISNKQKIENELQIISPSNHCTIHYSNSDSAQTISAEVLCLQANQVLYWHLDDNFIGKTQQIHELKIYCTKGKHTVYVTNEFGKNVSSQFLVK